MITIHATDRDGTETVIKADAGGSLMRTLRDEGLDIPAICGGVCSCATCHVFIDPDWTGYVGPPGQDKQELLLDNPDHIPGRSRLACQVALTPALDGLRIAVAPIDA